jgi:hypothetical protein
MAVQASAQPEIIVYTDSSFASRRLKSILRGMMIPYEERNVEKEPAYQSEATALSPKGLLPAMQIAGYGVIVQPEDAHLQTALTGWGNRGRADKLQAIKAIGMPEQKKARA